jgi:hypothetical protein
MPGVVVRALDVADLRGIHRALVGVAQDARQDSEEQRYGEVLSPTPSGRRATARVVQGARIDSTFYADHYDHTGAIRTVFNF